MQNEARSNPPFFPLWIQTRGWNRDREAAELRLSSYLLNSGRVLCFPRGKGLVSKLLDASDQHNQSRVCTYATSIIANARIPSFVPLCALDQACYTKPLPSFLA